MMARIKAVAVSRGITVAGVLSEAGIDKRSLADFLNHRNKTEPTVRTCSRILALQERCGIPPQLTFEIDGRRVLVTVAPNNQSLTPNLPI